MVPSRAANFEAGLPGEKTNIDRGKECDCGGFLGMGTRYVAIDPKAVTLARQDEKNWKATMNANKDQLKAAPEYKYESEWRKR